MFPRRSPEKKTSHRKELVARTWLCGDGILCARSALLIGVLAMTWVICSDGVARGQEPEFDPLGACLDSEARLKAIRARLRLTLGGGEVEEEVASWFRRRPGQAVVLEYKSNGDLRFRIDVLETTGPAMRSLTCDGVYVTGGTGVLWDIEALRHLFFWSLQEDWEYKQEFTKWMWPYYAIVVCHLFPNSHAGRLGFDLETSLSEMVPLDQWQPSEQNGRLTTIDYGFGWSGEAHWRKTFDLDHGGMLVRFELLEEGRLVVAAIEYSDPVELADALWVPRTMRLKSPDYSGVILVSTLDIESAVIGATHPAETFEIARKENDIVRHWPSASRVTAEGFRTRIRVVVTVVLLLLVGSWLLLRRLGARPVTSHIDSEES